MPDRPLLTWSRLLEAAGFTLIATGGWLLAPWLGLILAGIALLNWAYGARSR